MKQSTTAAGQETIQQQLDKAQAELEALDGSMLASRTRLQECLARWGDYEKKQDDVVAGLGQVKEQLEKGVQPQEDLAAKQHQAEHFKVTIF